MSPRKAFPNSTTSAKSAQDEAEKHSPEGGLREIRRRNGVDVDGPPDIREEFLAKTRTRLVKAEK